MDTPVLGDQQINYYIQQLYTEFECCQEDLPRVMAHRDGWQERESRDSIPSI